MKILFLTAAFYPSIGGVETHTYNLSAELIKLGHKITVVTEQPQPKILSLAKIYHSELVSASEAKDEKSNVESTQIDTYLNRKLRVYRFYFGKPSRLKKFKIWQTIFKHRALIRDADVVHCHDVFIWYFPFRFLFPSKHVYTTFHGFETEYPPAKKAIFLRKVSEKLSRGIICVGDYIKKWYGTKPDMVTYGAVDKQTLLSASRPQKVVNKKHKQKIILVGRLTDDIGVPLYIKLLKQIRKQGIPFLLDVYGEGFYRRELQRLGRIRSFQANLTPLFRKADIVFASSYLIMLQALALGKPVVAVYSNPLKRDYLLDSPFKKYIISGNSPKDLVEKIRRGMNKKVIQEGRNWAQRQTWKNIAQNYIELWKK